MGHVDGAIDMSSGKGLGRPKVEQDKVQAAGCERLMNVPAVGFKRSLAAKWAWASVGSRLASRLPVWSLQLSRSVHPKVRNRSAAGNGGPRFKSVRQSGLQNPTTVPPNSVSESACTGFPDHGQDSLMQSAMSSVDTKFHRLPEGESVGNGPPASR